MRRSYRRGGGDVSLGRLLGAGRGAPIIVAGDRSETSPSNTSSSARKSCHRGSLAAPRASHTVCQHPGWGTGARGLTGLRASSTRAGDEDIWVRVDLKTLHLPSKIEYLTCNSVFGEFDVSYEWKHFVALGPFRT